MTKREREEKEFLQILNQIAKIGIARIREGNHCGHPHHTIAAICLAIEIEFAEECNAREKMH